MCQIISALNQKLFKIFEIKHKYKSFKSFGSNHIVPDRIFLRAFKTQDSHVLIKSTLEDNMGQPILSPIKL